MVTAKNIKKALLHWLKTGECEKASQDLILDDCLAEHLERYINEMDYKGNAVDEIVNFFWDLKHN